MPRDLEPCVKNLGQRPNSRAKMLLVFLLLRKLQGFYARIQGQKYMYFCEIKNIGIFLI